MEEIERLQDNLLLIRRAVGWTASYLGERIGVTRQTINNIESDRNKLTKTQYIAIRSVLDAEIMIAPKETEMLKILLEVLIDNPEKYSKEDREKLKNLSNMMVPSILMGTTSREKVSKEWIGFVATIVSVGSLLGSISMVHGVTDVNNWLLKLMKSSKK